MKLPDLEASFQSYIHNLPKCIPDGLIQVDIELLQKLDLLNWEKEKTSPEDMISHYFHVVEEQEKITLYNDRYAIWIVPDLVDNNPTTFALVAVCHNNQLHLELGFSTSGIYNTSRIVLRVLEKLLKEIEETQDELSRIKA